jgi:hypothetical protein
MAPAQNLPPHVVAKAAAAKVAKAAELAAKAAKQPAAKAAKRPAAKAAKQLAAKAAKQLVAKAASKTSDAGVPEPGAGRRLNTPVREHTDRIWWVTMS